MSTSEIVNFFVNDTLQMCTGVLLLVVSFKIYRLKCESTSACGEFFKMNAQNDGGEQTANSIVRSAV